MKKITGEKITSIHICGAGFQNQFLPDESEVPCKFLRNAEENEKERKRKKIM